MKDRSRRMMKMRMLAPSVTSNCQLFFAVFAVLLLQDRPTAVCAKQVHAPPVIAEGLLREISFKERERVELPCVASGDPPPAYSWKKDGEPLVISGIIRKLPGVGTIQIEDPTAAAHEGIYQCFASNEFGTAISVKTTLKKAVQEPFPTIKEPKIHRPYVGHALTLRCQPPYGYPKGVVYWGEFKQGLKLKPIENNERMSLDYEGNLHFSNIEMADDRGEFRYVCIVQNMELRSLVQGDDQKISPMSAQPRYGEPRIMWTTHAKEVAIKGQTKKLKCIFGGYPTPRVTWTRVDRPLVETPGRIQRSSFGQELVFSDVDFSDEGTYECSAVNTESGQPKAIRRTQLVVEFAPHWKDDCPPENVNTSEEESAQFNCEAEGVPQPTISWFINGVPLSELPSNRRRFVANDNRFIRYENVTKTDAQVLQCNASNEHGYIFSNVYLNVLVLNNKVKEFLVIERGSNHLKLSWQMPLKHNGSLKSYIIEYKEAPPSMGPARPVVIGDIHQLQKKLNDLEPDTTYIVYIWATTALGRGVEMFLEERTNAMAAPSVPAIASWETGDNSVNVSWTSTTNDSSDNPGHKFNIEYKKLGSDDEWTSVGPESENNWLNVSNFESETEYNFRVVAMNNGENKTTSEPTVILIGPQPVGKSIASAGWFIALLCILIFLLLLLILWLIKRYRGDEYAGISINI